MKKLISILTVFVLCAAFFPHITFAETVPDTLTAEQLTNDLPNLVTKNLTLPTVVGETAIEWVSSDPSVISATGIVTRDTFEEKTVTLTAKTTTAQKVFCFTVAPITANVLYQDSFYYPDWLDKDFLTAQTGNTIGWTKLWNSVNTHRITKTENSFGQDNFVLRKDANITERTVYTLPKSPDTLTLSFDLYYDIDSTAAAIYDYYFYLNNEKAFYLRYNLTAQNGIDVRLFDTNRQQIAVSQEAAYNIRQNWLTFTMELNQLLHTLNVKINDTVLCTAAAYTTEDARLSKIQLQPGSQSTCGALLIDNISLVEYKNPATYSDEIAVEKTLESITADSFTDQSSYAVTKNLDLSSDEINTLLEKNNTSIAFSSNNPGILSIQNTGNTPTGIITPQSTEQTVVLTATVSRGVVSKSKNISLIVPAKEAYVYDSAGFGAPALKNQYLSSLNRWSGAGNDTGFYSKITEENGEYYIAAKRDVASSSPNYYSYSFNGLRKTKTVSVEMTLTYKEQNPGGTFYYDFEFYGKDKDNRSDSKNRIAYVRINAGTIRAYANPTNTSYSSARAVANGSNRLRFEFNFDAQNYDLYVDEQKVNTDPMPFPASFLYAAPDRFDFTAFRTMTGASFQIDDFVVKSDTPDYINSYFEDVCQRPLTLSIDSYKNQPELCVTSEYDSNNDLRQNFILLNAGNDEKNVHFDFKGAYLIDKSTLTQKCLLENVISDETTPVNINNLYLGANHGPLGVEVTSANHGKTIADIGSLWKAANNQQWTLLRIVDNNTLLFLAEIGGGSKKNFSFPSKIEGSTLTYISHGTNSSAITIASQKENQVYPSIANVVPKAYIVRDNVKSEVSDLYTPTNIACDKVIMEISYDIMNPALIGSALRSQRPDNGFAEAPNLAAGEALVHYNLRMTVDECGTVLTEFDHEILKDLSSIEYYGHQWYPRADIYGGGVYRYLPGTKAFSAIPQGEASETSFDFSTPFDMNNTFPESTRLTKDAWSEPDKYVPDRIVDYMKNADGKNVMAYATGYIPIDDAAPESRLKNTSQSIFLYGSKKAYPVFINSSDYTKAGAHIKGAAYRKYENLSAQSSKTEVYTINYDHNVYYYIDFLTETSEELNLSETCKIYNPKIIYKSSGANCKILGDKISVSGSAKDYIVICANRGVELTDAVYNPESSQATVRIYNHQSEDTEAVLIAASYKNGNQINRITSIPVSLNKNSVTIKDIDIHSLDAEKLTFFIWKDLNTLQPLGAAKTTNP